MMAVGAKAAGQTNPVVETSSGKIRGLAANGVISFRGVPYAQADRFEAPRAPEPWGGVRDALAYGPIAPQVNPDPTGPSPIIIARLPRPLGASPPPRAREDEACQVLNVWTSAIADGRKRPVMVWLHGGFFSAGSGATGDGTALARRGDVVVVSLNHRLNVLGFSHLDQLPGGQFQHTGSLGVLDIVAALRWVKTNIAAFGGDPDRIMVFGESGGGMKTSWLLASPAAAGTMHRAAILSGPGLRMMERDRAAAVTEQLLRELGLRPAEAGALRTLPIDKLMAAYFKVAAANPARSFTDLSSFAPVLDPELLPHHPFSPRAPAQARTIPLLIGWNAQDMTFFMGADDAAFSLDEAGLKQRAQTYLGADADRALAVYRSKYPDASPSRLYAQSFSDEEIMAPTLVLAERQAAQQGAPVYVYRFDWQSPALGGKLGATHTLEAPFIFNNVESQAALIGPSPAASALAEKVSATWVAFASSGDANGGGLPHWAPYGGRREVMLIDDQSRLEADPAGPIRPILTRRYS